MPKYPFPRTLRSMQKHRKTDFGFQDVFEKDKPGLVRDLFRRVASKYDRMNDLMSLGLHRVWKKDFVQRIPKKPGMKLLDVAGGTGDIALRFAKENQSLKPHVTVYDLTQEMLDQGRANAIDQNLYEGIDWQQGMAEELPFEENTFDAYTISFGFRNVTDKSKVLAEALRVLKPGAPFLCLEFSQIQGPLSPLYKAYAMQIIPLMGKVISQDKEAYRYLSESIERFPEADLVEQMIHKAGFEHVLYETFVQGLVAIHQGWKPEMKEKQ